MANQANKVKMYTCSGWQNVAEHSQKQREFSILTSDYSLEHAHSVMSFTHARNESLEELIEDLKKAAKVSSLRYKLVDEAA
ncbi:hypothetical protein [Hymenobacter algoricola]|uniref:Uncharacterized protein n=1 Tax=Hymenobacter algoricola TaxID=486267 RepID=A0ABP7NC85_9BACT